MTIGSSASTMTMRKCLTQVARSMVAPLRNWRLMMPNASRTGPISCVALAVGLMPRPTRTNSGSSMISRRRLSLFDTAGWVICSRSAARTVTPVE